VKNHQPMMVEIIMTKQTKQKHIHTCEKVPGKKEKDRDRTLHYPVSFSLYRLVKFIPFPFRGIFQVKIVWIKEK
jgi:hypothetical protein